MIECSNLFVVKGLHTQNVATNKLFSYAIGYYSVNVPSQPYLANIEIAGDVVGRRNQRWRDLSNQLHSPLIRTAGAVVPWPKHMHALSP